MKLEFDKQQNIKRPTNLNNKFNKEMFNELVSTVR